ncbi:MAG: hypothetical protein AAF456_07675 [Planctomycetota bacterium]
MPDYSVKKSLLGRKRVVYRCPGCDEGLRSPLGQAGQQDYCPYCGVVFVVPGLKGLREDQRIKAERQERKNVRQREKAARREKAPVQAESMSGSVSHLGSSTIVAAGVPLATSTDSEVNGDEAADSNNAENSGSANRRSWLDVVLNATLALLGVCFVVMFLSEVASPKDFGGVIIIASVVLIFRFQRRVLRFLGWMVFGNRPRTRTWWRIARGLVLNAAMLLLSITVTAAVVDSNPDEQAHERFSLYNSPLEELAWNINAMAGSTEIEYRDFGVFSTRTISLDMIDHPEFSVPISYGFLGEVYSYDDPRLEDAITILESVQKSSVFEYDGNQEESFMDSIFNFFND